MKLLRSTLCLLPVLLLASCGANKNTSPAKGTFPAPEGSMASKNWELDTTSTAGMPSLSISGSVNIPNRSLTGAMHVNGSSCFDPGNTVAFTGTLSAAGALQLSSATVAGQVITLNGTVGTAMLTGTYSIQGGCGSGDEGTVIGSAIPYIANSLNGRFTSSTGQTFDIVGNIAQNASPNSDGSYGIKGTAAFTAACWSSGTLTSGSLQSGSFIIGTSVGFQIQTSGGILTFLGTLNQLNGGIDGNYTVSGGTCDQVGTAALFVVSPGDNDPWGY
jgi:hypothetical protein